MSLIASRKQIKRSVVFNNRRAQSSGVNKDRGFDYTLNYNILNLRQNPELYRVGIGEQGVLLVEPYKSEILPHWKFKNPASATASANAISEMFYSYRDAEDFVGMDMSRKFLQMGFTRARRYANHSNGRKYARGGDQLPFKNDETKAESAEIFWKAWQSVESDEIYLMMKTCWRKAFG